MEKACKSKPTLRARLVADGPTRTACSPCCNKNPSQKEVDRQGPFPSRGFAGKSQHHQRGTHVTCPSFGRRRAQGWALQGKQGKQSQMTLGEAHRLGHTAKPETSPPFNASSCPFPFLTLPFAQTRTYRMKVAAGRMGDHHVSPPPGLLSEGPQSIALPAVSPWCRSVPGGAGSHMAADPSPRADPFGHGHRAQ